MIIFALLEWLAQNKDRIWPPAQFRESSSRGSVLPEDPTPGPCLQLLHNCSSPDAPFPPLSPLSVLLGLAKLSSLLSSHQTPCRYHTSSVWKECSSSIITFSWPVMYCPCPL